MAAFLRRNNKPIELPRYLRAFDCLTLYCLWFVCCSSAGDAAAEEGGGHDGGREEGRGRLDPGQRTEPVRRRRHQDVHGGTPLFDENTGTTRDRYDYILSHHPERPWLAEGAETATLFAAETKVEENEGQGSVAGVFAMLGVFTVVLAGVAVLKMHQGRRERFRYNPIHSREQ